MYPRQVTQILGCQVDSVRPKISVEPMLQPLRYFPAGYLYFAHRSMRQGHICIESLAVQVSRLLQYSPVRRYSALQALTHPFFDELRDQSVTLPNGELPQPALLFTEAF